MSVNCVTYINQGMTVYIFLLMFRLSFMVIARLTDMSFVYRKKARREVAYLFASPQQTKLHENVN